MSWCTGYWCTNRRRLLHIHPICIESEKTPREWIPNQLAPESHELIIRKSFIRENLTWIIRWLNYPHATASMKTSADCNASTPFFFRGPFWDAILGFAKISNSFRRLCQQHPRILSRKSTASSERCSLKWPENNIYWGWMNQPKQPTNKEKYVRINSDFFLPSSLCRKIWDTIIYPTSFPIFSALYRTSWLHTSSPLIRLRLSWHLRGVVPVDLTQCHTKYLKPRMR